MRSRGFTIVELLIVIIVIAVLAAITIVAFNGIQQRANNSSRINSVGQLIKLINAYTATYGVYPSTSSVCGTTDGLCTNNGGNQNTTSNTALMTELSKVGNPPVSVQPAVASKYGVQYIYEGGATFNNVSAPIRLEYWLEGQNTPCGLGNVTTYVVSPAVSSTTGYTATLSSPTPHTLCWIRLGMAG